MAIDLAGVRNEVMDILNASSAPGVFDDTEWNDSSLIDAAILDVDAEVVLLICATKGHPRRQAYMGSALVAHGAQIPSSAGPIESVTIGGKAAQEATTKQRIERDRANTLSLTTIKPRYFLEGNTLWHNGATTASVAFPQYTRGAAPQAPDEYRAALVHGAISRRFGKDAVKIGGVQAYGQMYVRDLQMVAAGAPSLEAAA